MSPPNALTEALAAVQAELPEVGKDKTATVPTKAGGKYSYSYADLAAVTKAILPVLARHGLAWVTRPTLADGRLVLAYELRHVSGGSVEGVYPLTGGTPQEIGSAITYARRYCLCSVTGVAPESDDDDAAAASHKRPDEVWEQASRPPTPEQVQAFGEFGQAIAGASKEDDVVSLGGEVKRALIDGLITDKQYERLTRVASNRLSALRAEPVGDGGTDG